MSADTKLSLIIINPDGTVERRFVPDSLQGLQQVVGGLIEYLPRCELDPQIVGIVNEEGKQLGLEPNPHATALFPELLAAGDVLRGKVILARRHGDLLDDYPACSLDLAAADVGPGEDTYFLERRLRVYEREEGKDA